jgi:hypothetical protein
MLPEAREEMNQIKLRHLGDLPDDWSLLPLLAHLAAASFALGDPDMAATVRRLLAPHVECHVVLGPAILYLGPAVFYSGLTSLALSADDDAIEEFERTIAACDGMAARPFAARAHLHLGEARARRGQGGDLERAREAADTALALSRELGLLAVEQRVSALHERLRRSSGGGL